MNAEYVMVPCPVCQRERELPITTKYSVWAVWRAPCLYCQYAGGGRMPWLTLDLRIRATA